jgi:hypothetical protein
MCPDSPASNLDRPANPGRLVGLLLVVQLATGLIVPYILLLPLTLRPAAFLEAAAPREVLVRFNVLSLFLGGALAVAVSTLTWSAVRHRAPLWGLWMLVLAGANLALQVVENAHWMTMLSVSQAYAEADPASATAYATIGIAVRSAWRWAHYTHILVVVARFFALYAALFRAAVVPRPVAVLGIAVCALHTAGITLPAFAGYRVSQPMIFGMPLGFATLALAVTLIAKGFVTPRADSEAVAKRLEDPRRR